MSESAHDIVTIRDLHIRFNLGREKKTSLFRPAAKKELHAVRGVNLTIRAGETFSIVGESGCGKSTIARALAGVYKPSGGEIQFAWQDSATSSRGEQNGTQMIFQDPYASLNPRWRIGRSLAEPLVLAKKWAIAVRPGSTVANCWNRLGSLRVTWINFPMNSPAASASASR